MHYSRSSHKSSLLTLHDGTCVMVVHHTGNYKSSLLTLHDSTCVTVVHHTKNYKTSFTDATCVSVVHHTKNYKSSSLRFHFIAQDRHKMDGVERLRTRERYRLSRSAVSSVQLQNVLTQVRPTMLKHLSSYSFTNAF